jgi:hypothetical protein
VVFVACLAQTGIAGNATGWDYLIVVVRFTDTIPALDSQKRAEDTTANIGTHCSNGARRAIYDEFCLSGTIKTGNESQPGPANGAIGGCRGDRKGASIPGHVG